MRFNGAVNRLTRQAQAVGVALLLVGTNVTALEGSIGTIHRLAGTADSGAPQILPLAPSLLYGFDFSAWDRYTRSALMPEFAVELGFDLSVNLGILADHEYLFLPRSALRVQPLLGKEPDWSGVDSVSSQLLRQHARVPSRFERTLFTPSISGQFGPASVDVAAVFAHQQYASWGLGWSEFVNGFVSPSKVPHESAAGAGVRLGFSRELAPGVQLGATYQSRIDMDAFQSYRGVYSEPGDFDIPAAANVGITLQASERAVLRFDVQRVLYSEINSFTSALLPDRFLSLLGDSSSPEFNWRDLTVFRLGWNWQDSEDLSWQINYSTRQQPSPSSSTLARALSADLDENVMSFGFTKRTGRNALLNVAASYSPVEYVLGANVFGERFDPSDDLLEFEVMWVWNF